MGLLCCVREFGRVDGGCLIGTSLGGGGGGGLENTGSGGVSFCMRCPKWIRGRY